MALITFSWFLDISIFIAGIIGPIYLYYQKKFRVWPDQDVPHFKPSFPFGNAGGMAVTKSIGLTIKEIYDSSEGYQYFGFWNLFRPMILIRDLDLIKTVFVKDFMNFHDRGVYYNEKDDPLSANMFALGGARWKYIRNKLSPTFTSGKMKMMFPTLVECSKELDALLDKHASKEEVIEVKDIVARFTTDVISSCAFGIQANCLKDPDAEFRKWGRKFFSGTTKQIFKNTLAFLTPQIAELIKLSRTPKDVSDYFLKAIRETMDYREKNAIKRNDFLQLILELKNHGKLSDENETDVKNGNENFEEDITKFTFEESAAQVFVFYIAGFETSSTALQFCLYELSLNPEIQNKTREEINRVLDKHKGVLSYESLHEMEYVARVIDETLRKYPSLPFLQRECNRHYQIPGTDVIVPKGTLLVVSNIGIHRDPQYYPNPEKFDPDRFTEEEKSKRHHYAYLPFGEGPRNCIGMRFGLMQARIGLITLLRKYKFEISKETPVPLEINAKSITMAPKGGMYLRISKA